MDLKVTPRFALLLSAVLLISACNDFTGPARVQSARPESTPVKSEKDTGLLPSEFLNPNDGDFTERKMLVNIGTQILAKQAESFANQVPVLKESLEQFCTQLRESSDVESGKTRVQSDWKRVMLAFHNLEGAPFGPFVNRSRFVVDNLYSFPYLNTCGIDQGVLANTKGTPNVSELLYNVRGLGAIEYLLFEDSLKSKCNLRANPDMKTWNELPANLKSAQRCEWAVRLMGDIEDKANFLKSEWAVQGGNYTLKLVNRALYASEKEAINALTDSMSHIEFLKDVKLGRPLGRHKDCTEDVCPQDVEHRYSGLSLEAVEAQLKSFRAVFYGSLDPNKKAFGIDDLLVVSGRQDVLERMAAALNQALVAVRALQKNGNLQEQIQNYDPKLCKESTSSQRAVEICALHADVREMAFIWKTEVLVALSLRAPPSHQGDND